MPYSRWLPTLAPPPLAGPNGANLLKQLGAMFDEQRDRANQGTLSSFPTKGSVDSNGVFGTPPSDALDAIGFDRKLPRGPGESDAAYGARLQAAWTAWSYAGSHYGVLRALSDAGFVSPKAILVQDNGRWSQITGGAGTIADWTFGNLTPQPNRGGDPGWFFDLDTDFFSRFALVYTSMPTALDSASAQTVHNQFVNTWRAGKADFIGTYVILSGRIWGFAASPPTLPLWGTGTWGGSSHFILPNV